jgi:hypothetical protein
MNSAPPPGGRILRIVGIILMALTVAFNLMGGIGMSCVALVWWNSRKSINPASISRERRPAAGS